ncbi:MAG: LacI family DNA-binding transcriptional regulator [Coprococcus sp.]
MAKTVKLSDIGERLNVSAVTVSKALSGQKGVSEEMRQKIILVAEELGYTKRKKKTDTDSYTIGVVVAERYLKEGETFYWKLYQEVSQNAMTRNCFTMLEVISHEMEMNGQFPRLLSENRVDALIIMGTFKSSYANYLINNIKVPFLNLDTQGPMNSCDSVVSNNLMGGYCMTNYLFAMGHRKIGFVGTRLVTTSIDDRFLGYMKSLMEHGIDLRKDWLIDDRDREYGHIDAQNKFKLPEEVPTAFFCNCDVSASILIRKLKEAGYRVPEDISVVGFDNYIISVDGYLSESYEEIGLTTFEIDIKEMARRAVHIIVHKLENLSYSTGVFMLSGRFIERNSVKKLGEAVPFV